jgi:hypothetical protein
MSRFNSGNAASIFSVMSSPIKVEKTGFPEMLVAAYRATWRQVPEDSVLSIRYWENLKLLM